METIGGVAKKQRHFKMAIFLRCVGFSQAVAKSELD
jgi:hypothetical protein